MAGGDGADEVLNVREDFGDTYAEVRAWRVPQSERYPEGVKYAMQYGRIDGETITRYDNFPDHPDVAKHHKHAEDGSVERVDFPGLGALYRRFKREVRDHGETWH